LMRHNGPNPELFLAICHRPVIFTIDALTTYEG
jgi:hypothetical protein